MSYWENICESYIDNLFQASKINRIAFQTQCAQNIRKNFDQYIIPYQVSDEVRGAVTNIATTVTTPSTTEVSIAPFPKGKTWSSKFFLYGECYMSIEYRSASRCV